jgi:site-specific recombinase XerD
MNPYSYTSLVRQPEEAALISCVSEYLEKENCKETSYDLTHLVKYLKDNLDGVSIIDVEPRHIQAFIDSRSEKPATIRRRYYKIKGFFGYLESRYRSYNSPCYKIKLPRLELPVSHRIAVEDIGKIKAYLPTIKDHQTRISVGLKYSLAFDFGARPMDLRNITIAHLDLTSGIVRQLERKGGFKQDLPLSKESIALIRKWLPIRQRILKDSGIFRFESLPQEIQDRYPLLPSAYNNRLKDRMVPELFRISSKTIFDHMVNTALSAGVSLTPMQIRHTFAHDLYDSTLDLRLVQEAMGHTTTAITTRYTARGPERIREMVNMGAWRKAA